MDLHIFAWKGAQGSDKLGHVRSHQVSLGSHWFHPRVGTERCGHPHVKQCGVSGIGLGVIFIFFFASLGNLLKVHNILTRKQGVLLNHTHRGPTMHLHMRVETQNSVSGHVTCVFCAPREHPCLPDTSPVAQNSLCWCFVPSAPESLLLGGPEKNALFAADSHSNHQPECPVCLVHSCTLGPGGLGTALTQALGAGPKNPSRPSSRDLSLPLLRGQESRPHSGNRTPSVTWLHHAILNRRSEVTLSSSGVFSGAGGSPLNWRSFLTASRGRRMT